MSKHIRRKLKEGTSSFSPYHLPSVSQVARSSTWYHLGCFKCATLRDPVSDTKTIRTRFFKGYLLPRLLTPKRLYPHSSRDYLYFNIDQTLPTFWPFTKREDKKTLTRHLTSQLSPLTLPVFDRIIFPSISFLRSLSLSPIKKNKNHTKFTS